MLAEAVAMWTRRIVIPVVVFYLTLVFCFLLRVEAHPQDEKQEIPALSDYNRLLDLVFPRQSRIGEFADADYRIVLRFKPSFEPESQIIIRKLSKRGFEVVSFSLPELKDQSLYTWSEETKDAEGLIDGGDLSRRVKVEIKKIKVADTTMRELIDDLDNIRFSALQVSTLAPGGGTVVYVDGTTYELWIEGTDHNLHFALGGSTEGEAKSDHPLIRWMTRVRHAVAKAKEAATAR